MAFPHANQIDILNSDPKLTREKRHWDSEGYERTQRRNGASECPKCGLWWPVIEDPDMWNENSETGRLDAAGWWGGVVCEQCGILIVEQPDGHTEAYALE